MKRLSLILGTLLISFTLTAQSTLSTVEYQKINRQAVTVQLPFPEKTVWDAIDNNMQQMGYKGKDTKGFTVYRGVRMAQLGTENLDLYYLADRKSRKEKEITNLTLLISKGFDNFVADSTDATLMNKARAYLDSIRTMIADYDLELQISAQEDVVKKADKKQADLADEGQSLEKKKRNIEKDIEDNKKNQEKQKTEIDTQKQILETLKGKRRKS